MVLLSPIGLLVAAALLFSVFSIVLQYTVGNRRRANAIQKEMNDLQKEFKQAAEEKDEKKIKQLEVRQKDMMGLMMESMTLQFKPMLLILPMFVLLFGGFGFAGFLYDWFPGFHITLPLALHLTGTELLGLNVLHPANYGVRGFFLVCIFFMQMALQMIGVPLWDKYVRKKPAA